MFQIAACKEYVYTFQSQMEIITFPITPLERQNTHLKHDGVSDKEKN